LGKNILIVESGIPVVPFEQGLLLRQEHELRRVATGEEALQALRSQPADLLITDDRLSDMDGVDLVRRVREMEEGRSMSVIVMGSGPGENGASGVNRFLAKPIDGALFEEACRDLLSIEFRREVRLLVYVQVQGYLQNNLFLCNSVNLSASGILLLTARRLKVGEVIQLQITLPRERRKITVTGEITRVAMEVGSRLNAYGVRFTVIEPEDRHRIRDFIREEQAQGR